MTITAPENSAQQLGPTYSPGLDGLLDAVTTINDLLLARRIGSGLFSSLADILARSFGYPFCAIVLFDENLSKVELAGINYRKMDEQVSRRTRGGLLQSKFRLTEVRGVRWLQHVLEGEVYTTSDVYDAAVPFISRAKTGVLVRMLRLKQAIAVPLVARGKLLGALVIGSGRAEFGQQEHKDLVFLAQHTAVALENIRLLEDAEFRTMQQAALARSARMIARADTDEDVLRAIAATASLLTAGSLCSTYLSDRAGGLMCAQSYGDHSEASSVLRIDEDEGLIGRVFITGRPLVVGDVRTVQFHSTWFARFVRDFDIHSVMAVPLQTEHEKIGVLLVCNALPNLYTHAHLDLLYTLADHTTIALEKQQLLASARRRAAEQEALVQSARAIARLDLDKVLETIVSKASAIVRFSRCSVILYDEKADELYWAAGYQNSPALQRLRLPTDKGIVGHIFTTSESLVLTDMTTDPRSARVDIDDEEHSRSFMGVPLRGPNGNLGVLVTTRPEVGVFNERDLELLSTFADHATIALSNAYLYNSLQQREAERARLLHQVLTSQEAERRRMAVDIHDGPLQSIGVNLLALDRMRKHMAEDRPEAALREIAMVRSGMAAVVQELRDVISDLRPALLDTQGLAIAARSHLRAFSDHYGIETSLHDALEDRRLPATLEITFYRLMQEALTNVRKHADANRVEVRIAAEDEVVSISIVDNGRGFVPETRMTRALEAGHIGLHSMAERVEMIGGRMEVTSAPGSGTCLTFSVPLTQGITKF